MKLNRGHRLFRIARSLGLKVAIDYDANQSLFQRRIISLEGANANYQLRQLAHELGHYLVAPPSRRHRKDYGIPEQGLYDSYDEAHWDLDELKATLIENALLRACKMKPTTLHGNKDLVKQAKQWWEQQGKHLAAGILLIR